MKVSVPVILTVSVSPLLVLTGVLLDIQQHYSVSDSGIGLLQTGKSTLIP